MNLNYKDFFKIKFTKNVLNFSYFDKLYQILLFLDNIIEENYI